jgi:H+/Cl- antiporter ClcA
MGGLLIGIWKDKFGDSPEELNEVIKQVRKNHRYSYDNMFSSIISAILPLIIGASIGPEAGLTGIIACLCTWVADKLKLFNSELEELASIGITATLGTIFASPIFGFVEPLENEEETKLPKTSKNILYFLVILSSFGIFIFLNHLTNTHTGLHSIGTTTLTNLNYLYIIVLVSIGNVMAYFYFISRKLVKKLFESYKNNHILKGVVGGLLLGLIGTALPLTMFSGEEQIYFLLDNGLQIGLLILILTSIIKIVLTNVCIETGLKGGHFFPMIFSGAAMGYAMGILLNMDLIISMAVVTTAFMANVMKKPIAVVLLLIIIFPINLIPLMLATSVISCLFKTPKVLDTS